MFPVAVKRATNGTLRPRMDVPPIKRHAEKTPTKGFWKWIQVLSSAPKQTNKIEHASVSIGSVPESPNWDVVGASQTQQSRRNN